VARPTAATSPGGGWFRTALPSAFPTRAAMALAMIAGAALPLLAPAYYVQFASKLLLIGLAAMALNLVVGFGGLVSLCHAAFYGLAGYILALSSPSYTPASLWFTLPLAVGGAALAALVIGALSLRTRGIYFIMVTLAFGEMLYFLFHDTAIGGGSDGAYIYYKPSTAIAGWVPVDLETPGGFYLTVLGVVVLTVLLLRGIVQSPFGHALAAARDNERRARSLGFPVYRVRLTAFVISGALAGVAGYFAAAQYGFVAPQMLGWHLSATLLAMVVLGGMRAVTGPLLGAVALLGLEELLRRVTEHWKLAEGLFIILLALALPGGLRQLAALVFGREAEPAPERPPTMSASPTTGEAGRA
jgi:branched-chain amino acid transport system permease protein